MARGRGQRVLGPRADNSADLSTAPETPLIGKPARGTVNRYSIDSVGGKSYVTVI